MSRILTGLSAGWRKAPDCPLITFLFLGVSGRGKQLAFTFFCEAERFR